MMSRRSAGTSHMGVIRSTNTVTNNSRSVNRLYLGVSRSMNRLICFLIIPIVFFIFTQTISTANVVPTVDQPKAFEPKAISMGNLPSRMLASEAMVDKLLQNDMIETTKLSDPEPVPEPKYISWNSTGSKHSPEKPDDSTSWLAPDNWMIDLFGAAAFGDQNGELYTVHMSFETYVYKELSIAFQPFAGVGDGKSSSSGVYGLDGLIKHPLFTAGALTVNFEGGGGIQQAGPKSWPRDGSHFNWRPQIGLGMKYDTGKDQQLVFGGRWVHISNGGIREECNVGVDNLMLYGGFRLRF